MRVCCAALLWKSAKWHILAIKERGSTCPFANQISLYDISPSKMMLVDLCHCVSSDYSQRVPVSHHATNLESKHASPLLSFIIKGLSYRVNTNNELHIAEFQAVWITWCWLGIFWRSWWLCINHGKRPYKNYIQLKDCFFHKNSTTCSPENEYKSNSNLQVTRLRIYK